MSRSAAPLSAALALSVLAHVITFSGAWMQIPQTAADPVPLMARLEAAAPVVAAIAPTPAPRSIQPAHTGTTSLAAAPATVASDASPPWSLPPAAAEPVIEPEAPAVLVQQAPPAPDAVVVATAAPTTLNPPPAIIKTLPRRGRIAYSLNYYLSNNPFNVGRTVQTWEAVGQTYKVDSMSETVGLARFTRFGPRVYHSSGLVTEHGLLPNSFTAKVVLGGKADDSAAQFDWDKRMLQFGRPTDPRNAVLPAGSQDVLSFMYQLSLAPPARGRVRIPVTNGVRFENYELDVLDEEIMEMPMGPMRVLPIKQVRPPGSESIEIWLAAEYRYLPVRIRFIGRDGTPGGEQVATEIHVE